MLHVKKYKNGVVSFYCDKCDSDYEADINDELEDNCVLDVKLSCPKCNSTTFFFLLRCKDEYLSKSLNAELIALKEQRMKELEKDDGNC